MSNLFKSKFLLGVMVVAIMFVGTVFVNAKTANAADCSAITMTLKYGMRNSQVKCLQQMLNEKGFNVDGIGAGSAGQETTYFGNATKAAVVGFQATKGLAADGIFGPISRASLAAHGNVVVVPPPSGYAPAGCTSASGYSPVTGGACYAITSASFAPAGCTSASGFSPVTGGACYAVGTTPPPTTGPISVMLASDNPAAGYIIENQATADLAHFAFSGNGTLNSLTLKRTGISDQNALSNVYLYDGLNRLTDGYSFNTNGEIVMNNLGIAVNGSRTIAVKADVAAGAAATSSTIKINLMSFTAAGGSAQSVSISGNEMSIVVGSLASISLSANTVAIASVNAGVTAYTFWSAPLQVNTRAVNLKAANFRMIGSAPSDAIANIKLFVDGVDSGKVATVMTISGSNYAVFDFSAAPLVLSTGSHTLDVRGNVEKGSARTVQFSVQNAADLTIWDPQVGVNIAVTGTIPNNAGTITINAGSVTINLDTAFQAMTNITGGSSNVAIGKYKVHAYGEDVKIQSIQVTPLVTNVPTTWTSGVLTGTGAITVGSTAGFYAGDVITVAGGTPGTATVNSITSATVMNVTYTVTVVAPAGAVTNTTSHNNLDDVTLYFNGSQVGTQQDFTGTTLTFTLGSQMIAPAGTDSVFEVRANMRSTTGLNYTGGTVKADLVVGSSNAQGQNSLNTLSTPAITGNTLTIQTGLLAVSKNAGYGNQNVSPNTAGVKIGSFVLQNQSSSESVRATSLTVAIGGSAALTDIAGLRTSETSGAGATPVQPQLTNTFSVDFTLAPGATKTIDILADTSNTTGVNVITTLTVASIGVSSNVSSAGSAVVGQTITFAAGAVTNPPTLVSASSTSAQFIAAANGGAVDATKATFNFASTGGASTITELKFTVTGPTTATFVKVGSVSAPVVGGVAYLTGLNLAVPQGGSGLNLDAFVSYPEVGVSGLASTTISSIALTEVKYNSGSSTVTFSPSVSAPTMVLVGSKPTFAVIDSSDTLSNSLVKIAEVTISADAKGDIKIGHLPISVTSTNTPIIVTGANNIIVKDTNDTVVVTTNAGLAVPMGGTGTDTIIFGATAATSYLIPAGTSKTFRIYATVSGVSGAVGTSSLSTKLGVNTLVQWYDVAGNNTVAIDAANTYNYPSSTSVIIN